MPQTSYILAGNFIDGSGGRARSNVLLTVEEAIITAIGSATDLPPHDSTALDDLSHCTILPPLFDCSVFLSRSPAVDERMRASREPRQDIMLSRHINYCHTHGVLAVAENDDLASMEKNYRKENIIEIRTAGGLCRCLHDCNADSLADRDFLKIGYSADIDAQVAPPPKFAHKELCGFLTLKGEKKAVVVANGSDKVAEALDAGCDAIEQGYGMGEDNLRKMAEKNILWIPSVVRAKNSLDGAASGGSVCCRFSTRYVAPGKAAPGAEVFWKKMLSDQIAQLALARKLGVKTAVGTGAGSVGILHGESMVEEMKLFIKAGYSLEETIRCASENGASFFGMTKLGALGVGRRATFLVTRGTPQQLPRKLSYLEGIYIDGNPSKTYSKTPSIHPASDT